MRIILVNPKEPGNIGSAARVMKNFGLHELFLVAPKCELSKAAFYMATHAADVVENAVIVDTTLDAVADRSFVIGTTARQRSSAAFEMLSPREAAERFTREGLAIMFGTEASGLSNEDLDYCQAYINIPTSQFASMNLAQAVNLVAYEFFVSDLVVDSEPSEDLAQREEVERMYERFLDVMHHIGYSNEMSAGITEHMYRRIFDRARLSKREVAALHGLWRQVKWVADHQPEQVAGNKKSR